MAVLFFLASVGLVSLVAALLCAQLVVDLPFFDEIGPFSAGLLGVAACFAIAYGGFYLIDPDPVSEFDVPVPLHLRTLPITAFSALIWLPIYATVFNALRRAKGAA